MFESSNHRHQGSCKGLVSAADVRWSTVAEILNLGPQALPATTVCPLCQGRMLVYHTKANGDWQRCSNCKFAGDPVELLAAAWGTSLRDAYLTYRQQREQCQPTQDEVNAYLRDGPELRTAVDDLWRQCQAGLFIHRNINHGVMGPILQLILHTQPRDREDGPAKLIGSCEREWIIMLQKERQLLNYSIPGPSSAAAVVPFWAAPGLMSGLLLISSAKNDLRPSFWPAMPHLKKTCYDVGIAGLQYYPDMPSGPIVLTNNVLRFTRMHLQNFRVSHRPIPLLYYHWTRFGQPQESLDVIRNRPAVIYSSHVDVPLILLANQLDAKITLHLQDGDKERIRHKDTEERMEMYLKRALPWRRAISEWARRGAKPIEVTQLREALEIYDISLQEVTRTQGSTCVKRVDIRNRVVQERGGRWLSVAADGKPKVLLDGIVRLLTVVHWGGHDGYFGYLDHGGQKWPIEFVLPGGASDVVRDRALWRCCKTILGDAGTKFPDMYSTAEAFYQPIHCSGSEVVGWSGQNFVFPHLVIDQSDRATVKESYFPPGSPAGLSRSTLNVRYRGTVDQAFRRSPYATAVLGAFLQCVASPCVGGISTVFLSESMGIPAPWKMLSVLGVTERDVDDQWVHNWPRLLRLNRKSRRVDWANQPPRQAIIVGTDDTAAVVGLSRSAIVLHAPAGFSTSMCLHHQRSVFMAVRSLRACLSTDLECRRTPFYVLRLGIRSLGLDETVVDEAEKYVLQTDEQFWELLASKLYRTRRLRAELSVAGPGTGFWFPQALVVSVARKQGLVMYPKDSGGLVRVSCDNLPSVNPAVDVDSESLHKGRVSLGQTLPLLCLGTSGSANTGSSYPS